MESKITIGKWEATALVINALSLQIFLNFPRLMAEVAGTAGWMLTLYVSFLAFLLFALIAKLFDHFEGKDILDVAEYVGGVPGRVFVGLIVLAHLVFAISVILREFGEDMKIIAYTVSPISYVLMFFVVGMAIGAYLGIEAIVRVHAYSVPIVIGGFLLIVLGVAPYYRVLNIFPVLGNGLDNIFIRGMSRVSVYSSLIILFLAAPYIKDRKCFKSIGYTAIGLSAAFMTTASAVYLLVVPYPVALENFLPIYQVARLIDYGRFFQRIEPVFMVIWIVSALAYLSMVLFFTLYVFRKMFGLKYYKPLILPFTVVIFTLSLLPSNLMEAIELETHFFRNFIWTDTFILTIAVLSAARIKKSLEDRKVKE